MTTRNTAYQPNPDEYWASSSKEEIASAIKARFDRYQQELRSSGRIDIWQMADRCFHGRNSDGGFSNSAVVTFGGEQGEIAQLHVGHFRQLVKQQHTIATNQRLAVEVTATSNDPEAVSQTVVARQVLEYDLDEDGGGLESVMKNAHMRALLYAEGYVVQVWDFHRGEMLGARPVMAANDNGEPEEVGEIPVHEGEIATITRSPLDVARDLDLDSTYEQPWYIVRTRVNRWDLAARFPEDEDIRRQILEAPRASEDEWTLWGRKGVRKSTGGDSDYVHMLTLYHMPTDALPMGRLVEVVGDAALYDDPYPYDHMVVHVDVPSDELDTAMGYGDNWDLLALSQALDAVESGNLSVQDAASLINYVAPRGQKADTKMLSSGMTLFEFDDNGGQNPRPPGIMERPEVRASDLNMAQHYQQILETLANVNATVRGTAESSVKSGADRALIATMSVQSNSPQQGAYAKLCRSTLNGRIKLYRLFLTEERTVEIAGRDKSGHVASFVGADLESVRRVRVDLGPPETRTIEGRIAIADKMLEGYGPQIISPDRYLALRTIGRIDDLDNLVAEHKVNARRENDMCRAGQGDKLQAIISDHHACHIREHVRELNDPAIRFDPNRTQEIIALTAHITEHAIQWANAAPEILAATGQDPAPSTLIGKPTGGGGPQPGAPANDNGMPAPGEPPIGQGEQPAGARLPQPPMNPVTGGRGVPSMPATQQPGGPPQ